MIILEIVEMGRATMLTIGSIAIVGAILAVAFFWQMRYSEIGYRHWWKALKVMPLALADAFKELRGMRRGEIPYRK